MLYLNCLFNFGGFYMLNFDLKLAHKDDQNCPSSRTQLTALIPKSYVNSILLKKALIFYQVKLLKLKYYI
jgi:hypothetical protein